MKKAPTQTSNLTKRTIIYRNLTLFCLFVLLGASAFSVLKSVSAQSLEKNENTTATVFPVGEKLTYTVSFGRFGTGGYAELYAVSRGRLEGRDAVELYSKFKTNDLVSAAFYMLDESRTTFADAGSGLPIYIRKTSNAGVSPTESVNNFLTVPTQNHDLVTIIYRLRNAGGAGSFLLQEDEKIYAVNAQTTVSEKVKTDAGEFETVVSNVQSEYFTSKGLKDFRVNFSSDERRIPVAIRFKTAKGDFQASLASVQKIEPETTAAQPTATPTPTPILTPTPVPTPTPSFDNQPLSATLPFVLGETLEYQITLGGQPVGAFVLQAKERRTLEKRDTLFLTATITRADRAAGLFNVGDSIAAQVNAESLAPFLFESKFTGTLSTFNQTVSFDQARGIAVFGGANQAQIPLNTHSLLSLAYAMRSFNLKPSVDKNNPVNDTRVSVFYDNQFYVFTVRPTEAELINLRNEKISAQMITIITGNPQLDALSLKVWLTNNEKRTPLRFSIGAFQADLISETIVPPKN